QRGDRGGDAARVQRRDEADADGRERRGRVHRDLPDARDGALPGGRPADAPELLTRGVEERVGGAEVAQDRATAGGADPLEPVEDRLEGSRIAAPAVE